MNKQQRDAEKQMKMHKASYFMYEKTKKECVERMSEAMNEDGSKRWSQEEINEKLQMIQMMQDDVKEKFIMNGGDPADLMTQQEDTPVKVAKKPIVRKNSNSTTLTPKKKTPIVKKEKTVDALEEVIPEATEKTSRRVSVVKESPSYSNNVEEVSIIPKNWNVSDFSDSFDVIPLPSKGEC